MPRRDEVLFTVDKALQRALHASDKREQAAPACAARAAKTISTVLIRGESGSGKEVTARAIHTASKRVSGPVVPAPLWCAA